MNVIKQELQFEERLKQRLQFTKNGRRKEKCGLYMKVSTEDQARERF